MPFLNLDDNFADHPKVDALSDGAFRQVVRDICAWSQTGVSTPFVQEFLDERLVRRAPRQWLPDRILTPAKRYRAKISLAVRLAVHERDGWACLHCGTSDDLTLDHVVPWSADGPDDESNLQTLCRPCNSRKGARV